MAGRAPLRRGAGLPPAADALRHSPGRTGHTPEPGGGPGAVRIVRGGLVIGAVGRLEEQKGHAHLLAALPELRRQIPDLVVLLVGEGRRQEDLRRQVRDLGLESTVRFLGTRRDLPEIYRALDLFVHPSLWEGLPLALLKAMGAGLPVVATRVSGSREAIVDGVNGCLVAPGDPEALARAILELHRHPEVRRRLGDAARRTVAAQYSLEAMLQTAGRAVPGPLAPGPASRDAGGRRQGLFNKDRKPPCLVNPHPSL